MYLEGSDLFGVLQKLLRRCCGQDCPVASWAELQIHSEACDQLNPQLCNGHFVVQHRYSLFSKNGV